MLGQKYTEKFDSRKPWIMTQEQILQINAREAGNTVAATLDMQRILQDTNKRNNDAARAVIENNDKVSNVIDKENKNVRKIT